MSPSSATLAAQLPEFPWDALVPYAERAARHPDGTVDLSIGTPVDPTPALIRAALSGAADAAGYPTARGTMELRRAVAAWFDRRRGVDIAPAAVLPTIGSKEAVAWLPTMLGLGPGDVVAHPAIAYPTYDIGARLARATPLPYGSVDPVSDLNTVAGSIRLVWVNSPANPTGRVADVAELRRIVVWAREAGAIVVSDECYAELSWDTDDVPSLLDPRVCDGGHDGLLVLASLSKRSNLAGYRAGIVAGDPALVEVVHQVRRHSGLMVSTPVQAAMMAALTDDAHVEAQRERYRSRREVLRGALGTAGWTIEESAAGLYLWVVAPDGDCWATVRQFAELGILVAPGAFYGPDGSGHVRLALTATDERIGSAVARLTTARLGSTAPAGTVR